MMISLVSASGSPGATTTALALSLAWPRRCLLVEADPTGASAVLAGYWRGRRPHDRGLMTLALAHRSGRLVDAIAAASLALTDDGRARVVPGLSSAGQGPTAEQLWPVLGQVLMERTGTEDVLVDAGRIGMRHSPEPILAISDTVLLVLRSGLPAVAAARASVDRLAGMLRDPAGQLRLLVVGDRRPYAVTEISSVVGVQAVGTVTWDPARAAALSDGRPTRRLASSPLLASARRLARVLAPPAEPVPATQPQPAAEQPVARQPAAEQPAAKQAVEQQAAEQPVAGQPAARQPVTQAVPAAGTVPGEAGDAGAEPHASDESPRLAVGPATSWSGPTRDRGEP